jgi:hypothetical protein
MKGTTFVLLLWIAASIFGGIAFWSGFKESTIDKPTAVVDSSLKRVVYIAVAVATYVVLCLVFGPVMAWRTITTPEE